ncbi:MAG: hypothetical protein L6U99_01815 [Clostridium sp.]|nr:MAG: hypothetical protein L6U99_01815 [Clostridium sp.]
MLKFYLRALIFLIKRIMDKYKVKKTVNERINDFIKVINYHNYLFYLFRYSVINELHLVKYDDLSYSEINIYEKYNYI